MKSKGLAELLPEDVDRSKLDSERLFFYSSQYPDTVKKMLSELEMADYEAK